MNALLQSQQLALQNIAVNDQSAKLRDARKHAMDAVAQSGLPSNRDELWKYTSLKALEKREFAVATALPHSLPKIEQWLLPSLQNAARLVFVNGIFAAELSKSDTLPQGVSLRAWSTASSETETLASPSDANGSDPNHAFENLNTAMMADGVLLDVADGVKVDSPIAIVFIGAADSLDVAWHCRNQIHIGKGASLSLVEHFVATAAHKNLGNIVSHVRVAENAKLNILRVQNEGEQASLIQSTYLELASSASINAQNLDFGCALSRHDIHVLLNGDQAHFESRGAYAVKGRQHCDNAIFVDHAVGGASCDLRWKGVADERARAVFNGTIKMRVGADGSDAQLVNKNLLLSPHAEIDTRPVLEIYAEEVKAAHGATVGQLDERALFYLRSRGLPLAQARNLLIFAFCREILDAVVDVNLREHLSALLIAQLPQSLQLEVN